MKRYLIADDHAVTRRGIADLLDERFPEASRSEVGDGDAAVAAVAAQNGARFELILLDVVMPGPGILPVLASIRAVDPKVPILVLTGSDEAEYIAQVLGAGADGLVLKRHAADELLHAVDTVLAGQSYLHPDSAKAMAGLLREKPVAALHELLSDRERQIFIAVALGRTIKEIGFALGLSDKTVATYLARIREKTGLLSHVDIARYALKNGLVD